MAAMTAVPWPLPTDYPEECRYATLLQIRCAGVEQRTEGARGCALQLGKAACRARALGARGLHMGGPGAAISRGQMQGIACCLTLAGSKQHIADAMHAAACSGQPPTPPTRKQRRKTWHSPTHPASGNSYQFISPAQPPSLHVCLPVFFPGAQRGAGGGG